VVAGLTSKCADAPTSRGIMSPWRSAHLVRYVQPQWCSVLRSTMSFSTTGTAVNTKTRSMGGLDGDLRGSWKWARWLMRNVDMTEFFVSEPSGFEGPDGSIVTLEGT